MIWQPKVNICFQVEFHLVQLLALLICWKNNISSNDLDVVELLFAHIRDQFDESVLERTYIFTFVVHKFYLDNWTGFLVGVELILGELAVTTSLLGATWCDSVDQRLFSGLEVWFVHTSAFLGQLFSNISVAKLEILVVDTEIALKAQVPHMIVVITEYEVKRPYKPHEFLHNPLQSVHVRQESHEFLWTGHHGFIVIPDFNS